MKNRRSLTPATGLDARAGDGVHAMRRAGGARREVSERVTLVAKAEGKPDGAPIEPVRIEGWALNVSRGGVRVILEDKVELGGEYDVTVGNPEKGGTAARGRIVWVQEEPDGAIVGVEFLGQSGVMESTEPPGAVAEKPSDKPSE